MDVPFLIRVLPDYELDKNNFDADNIHGCDYEEYTHMAAPRVLSLNFVPATEERYDLIIPIELLELPMIARVITLINSREFKESVEEMGDYSTPETGRVVSTA